MKRRILLYLGILACLTLFIAGCDGFTVPHGFAYEWVDPPPGVTSTIYITEVDLGKDVEPAIENAIGSLPTDISRIPLGGVRISIEGSPRGTLSIHSKSNGEIEGSWLVQSGWYQLHFIASKAGYKDTSEYAESRGPGHYIIIVVLVRDQV